MTESSCRLTAWHSMLRWRVVLVLLGIANMPVTVGARSDGALSCQFDGSSRLFEGEQPTVVAVLSPRMPYALQEWPRMRAVAEKLGLRVVPLHDPRVPTEEWRNAVMVKGMGRLSNIPAADEPLAAQCGLLNHTPAALVGRCGVAHAWPILGVMPDAAWASVIRSRLETLPKGDCG